MTKETITLLSINRIRLEFKVTTSCICGRLMLVLIESDWNLKEVTITQEYYGHDVLIESDWNLKNIVDVLQVVQVMVLIESDWNLKLVI